VHIAYQTEPEIGSEDERALAKLRDLARRHTNLRVAKLNERRGGILLYDDSYVESEFGWLSFRGERERVYRAEEGLLITGAAQSTVTFRRYVEYMDDEAVNS
jgi:hypothetical protein